MGSDERWTSGDSDWEAPTACSPLTVKIMLQRNEQGRYQAEDEDIRVMRGGRSWRAACARDRVACGVAGGAVDVAAWAWTSTSRWAQA